MVNGSVLIAGCLLLIACAIAVSILHFIRWSITKDTRWTNDCDFHDK